MLKDEASDHVMVVAHRACWDEGTPENSLAAIARCIALGVDMIEIDVALTKDGVPVLLHDPTLDRTTNMTGPVSAYTLAELEGARLKQASGGNAPLTDEYLPSLEQALDLAKGKILINLDVKGDVEGDVFDSAFRVVQQMGVDGQILMKMDALPGDATLDSAAFLGKMFFMPIIRECSGHTDLSSCTPVLSTVIPEYGRYHPIAYEIIFTDQAYFAEGVEAMKLAGGRIWVNALAPDHAAGLRDALALDDPDANWGRLIELGATIIQTDHPGELLHYLEALGRRPGATRERPAPRPHSAPR